MFLLHAHFFYPPHPTPLPNSFNLAFCRNSCSLVLLPLEHPRKGCESFSSERKSPASRWFCQNSSQEWKLWFWNLVQSTPTGFCRHGSDCTSSASGKNYVVALFWSCPPLKIMIASAASHISENWLEICRKMIRSATLFLRVGWCENTTENWWYGPKKKLQEKLAFCLKALHLCQLL